MQVFSADKNKFTYSNIINVKLKQVFLQSSIIYVHNYLGINKCIELNLVDDA